MQESGAKAFTMPARLAQKNENAFASHIIVKMLPPRSVWLLDAVFIFLRKPFTPSPSRHCNAFRGAFLQKSLATPPQTHFPKQTTAKYVY
ncbi:hypothetical protein EDM56_19530 [Brevibacillus fluminis]|uniref:Uncharacterized protein n=1 Tax=Brevibacillus fluminis TaxID=511487 RepID=A0A3M8DBU1_9BACL|nr:hypothetical protein [Brevibacillus fluminis]RNB85101.1 hypothetical protein EDM56_19530 [Brevibacillus fluminis]